MSVSAVIIAKNEEANIRRALLSLSWADEIIVVDSGSTDSTFDICREYPCRIVEHAWEGYARQKSLAASLAACDWVFSLDADEEVTPELADEIRRETANPSADVYTVPRRNRFLGRELTHGGWYPDRQLRLWRRGSGKFADVPLHEHFVPDDPTAKVGRLSRHIVHYTYPYAADFVRKADAYTTIEADAIIASGRLPKNLPAKIVTAFPAKFAEVYLYKGGWRDGLHGFVAAMMMSSRVFLRWVKVWENRDLTER